jgi:hypothetical protein
MSLTLSAQGVTAAKAPCKALCSQAVSLIRAEIARSIWHAASSSAVQKFERHILSLGAQSRMQIEARANIGGWTTVCVCVLGVRERALTKTKGADNMITATLFQPPAV